MGIQGHFLFFGFMLLTYSLSSSSEAHPARTYARVSVDTSTAPLTPTYGIATLNRSSFPEGFVFGAASAAYQVEGGWNEDGGKLSGGVNEEGIEYYNNLINETLFKGLKPFVTLYHFDVPQALEDECGGFLSPKIVINAYDSGDFAPGRCSSWISPNCTGGNSSTEPYTVAHHQLIAHAAAVKLYKDKYQKLQNGNIGITLATFWYVPFSNSTDDYRAARRSLDFYLGWDGVNVMAYFAWAIMDNLNGAPVTLSVLD
ncbi:unnamed protein product [Ilex paraguariensis]|uniref:Beta-glucosidase n=1 Tax=Ilex paraguariensis TaxID=185542 RepID=A0ABC8RLV8_9AQUA